MEPIAPRVTRAQAAQGDRLAGAVLTPADSRVGGSEMPGTALFKRKPGQSDMEFGMDAFEEILDSNGIFPRPKQRLDGNVDSGPSTERPGGPQQGHGASLGGAVSSIRLWTGSIQQVRNQESSRC